MINLPEVIQEMLSYKESLGFSRKTYENYLSDFNKYFFQLLAGPCHIFLQMMNCVECLPRAIRNRTVKQTHAAI